ncbi:hypothetical protein [Parenemella sanctibonifatiensis]|uniref:DUF2797 domain-containing protein n=1 Tax=Parenemella sanctibonifatiensis TaxID=2016505 RepID=A0A255E445_9ACTN|nr:hypothetical protein [Parenemella sanctibonifatiensis]OYN86357.1 hypothetical protein CGZ92_08325 [Parenemella sanctibonifatiensis]
MSALPTESVLVHHAGSRDLTARLVLGEPGVPMLIEPGERLGFSVDPVRWCLGHRDLSGLPVPCPKAARIETGRMCRECAAHDPWRWMHVAHRVQSLNPGLAEKLRHPHWLYVATFAGGSHKVGTAHDERKRVRLDEQGPLFAHWVALAEDGLVVRELEDLVSQQLGLGQVVRSSAKATGLSGAVDLDRLRTDHDQLVADVRDILALAPDVAPLAEPWPNPRDLSSLTGLTLRAYPGSLDAGSHGFTVQQCWGPVALVGLDDDPDSTYAVDLSRLIGHRLSFGDHATESPQWQDSLF